MAELYWGGGSGTWDATDATHWYSDAFCTIPAGVAPTASDNVSFNIYSSGASYAVTIGTNAVAQDITITQPATGSVTMTLGATAVINCYGTWVNSSSGVAFTTTTNANINFLATTTGKVVQTNNVTLGAAQVNFNGVGGEWTLGTAFTNTASNFVLAGSFVTNGYAYTAANLTASGTLTRSINLGASTLTLSATTPINLTNATNLTFNAGTSTIICTATSPTLNGAGQTFYTVNFTSVNSGTTSILGANTFTNITQTSRSASGQRQVSIGADQTITGTLTLQTTGTPSGSLRTFVQSDSIGTRRTLTVATLAGMTDVDFRDIGGAGTASWTGTRIGNCLNNTGITFTTGVNKYWNLAAGGNWTSVAWATSPGGAVSNANFPLAQDTVYIDLTTITTGSTIALNITFQIPTVICTRATGSNLLTISCLVGCSFYGNWTSCAGLSFTTLTSWTFIGQGTTQTITSNGISFSTNFTINSPGGTVLLADNLTSASTATLTLTAGTLDLNSRTLSIGAYAGTGTAVRSLLSNGVAIVLTGSSTSGNTLNIIAAGVTTNFTSDVRPTFNLTSSPVATAGTRNMSWGANVSNYAYIPNVNITNGSDIVTSSGTSTFNNLNFISFNGLFGNATRNIYGNLAINSGMSVGGGPLVTTFNGVGFQTIDTSENVCNFPMTFNGVGGTWEMLSGLNLDDQTLTLINGTLKLKESSSPLFTETRCGSFVTTGTNQKYLQSMVPGTQATLYGLFGTNTVTYLTIKDSNAIGGAEWIATNATNRNEGNNLGWLFGSPDVGFGTGNGGTCFGFGFRI